MESQVGAPSPPVDPGLSQTILPLFYLLKMVNEQEKGKTMKK